MDPMEERRRRILERGKKRLDLISSGKPLQTEKNHDDQTETNHDGQTDGNDTQSCAENVDTSDKDASAKIKSGSAVVKSVVEALLNPEPSADEPSTERTERERDETMEPKATARKDDKTESKKSMPKTASRAPGGERRHIRSLIRITIGIVMIRNFSTYFFGYGLLAFAMMNAIAIHFTEPGGPPLARSGGADLLMSGSSALRLIRHAAQDVSVLIFLLSLL